MVIFSIANFLFPNLYLTIRQLYHDMKDVWNGRSKEAKAKKKFEKKRKELIQKYSIELKAEFWEPEIPEPELLKTNKVVPLKKHYDEPNVFDTREHRHHCGNQDETTLINHIVEWWTKKEMHRILFDSLDGISEVSDYREVTYESSESMQE
jgi:hypothetical protein